MEELEHLSAPGLCGDSAAHPAVPALRAAGGADISWVVLEEYRNKRCALIRVFQCLTSMLETLEVSSVFSLLQEVLCCSKVVSSCISMALSIISMGVSCSVSMQM